MSLLSHGKSLQTTPDISSTMVIRRAYTMPCSLVLFRKVWLLVGIPNSPSRTCLVRHIGFLTRPNTYYHFLAVLVFRIRKQMSAVDANCLIQLQNGTFSCCAFHNLWPTDWNACLPRINLMQWGAACITNNLSCGTLWGVYGAGPDNQTTTLMVQGPFLSQE